MSTDQDRHLDPDVVIRSLTADDLDLFATVTDTAPNAVAWYAAVRKGVDKGHSRPEWCFVGMRPDAEAGWRVTGRVSYWGFLGSPAPFTVWHADWAAPDAVAVLGAAQRALGGVPSAEFVLPAGQHPTTDRASAHAVLLAAGFALDLERLELDLDASTAPPQPASTRLRFAAARGFPRADVVGLVERVLSDTLDHRLTQQVAQRGARSQAEDFCADLMNADAEPDWFEIGFRGDEPVGLVVPCRGPAGISQSYLDFIGVLPEHRGNRYADDLLARGTATLLAAGADHIVANTDVANTPTAAAFARAGYGVVGRVYQYFWKQG